MNLVLTDAPAPEARTRIAGLLGAFNTSQAGPGDWRPLALLIEDADGAVAGGLWGMTGYRWLNIELLFVPDRLRARGLGAHLLRGAETEAMARGCHAAWLDTFGFQAQGFYQRQGYSLFGELDAFPPGFSRYFMRKALARP